MANESKRIRMYATKDISKHNHSHTLIYLQKCKLPRCALCDHNTTCTLPGPPKVFERAKRAQYLCQSRFQYNIIYTP